ncbi:MAG: type IV toxin-antitoxin system AbiEi family antitoxin domain-containing protein [Planctomycetota bacterium]
MPKVSEVEKTILSLVRKLGVLRLREATDHGIHPEQIRRLAQTGRLVRSGRGLYVAANFDAGIHNTLAQASKRVPHGVICLLSALRFHEIGTQNPSEVWMAISPKSRLPHVDAPHIRFARFSGPALSEGVEEHRGDGVPICVYSVAKTVADCFKYRNKIGIDVAMEALRDCRRKRKATSEEFWKYARICRVEKIMKPYMEAIR